MQSLYICSYSVLRTRLKLINLTEKQNSHNVKMDVKEIGFDSLGSR